MNIDDLKNKSKEQRIEFLRTLSIERLSIMTKLVKNELDKINFEMMFWGTMGTISLSFTAIFIAIFAFYIVFGTSAFSILVSMLSLASQAGMNNTTFIELYSSSIASTALLIVDMFLWIKNSFLIILIFIIIIFMLFIPFITSRGKYRNWSNIYKDCLTVWDEKQAEIDKRTRSNEPTKKEEKAPEKKSGK
jgi:hypothetical protein